MRLDLCVVVLLMFLFIACHDDDSVGCIFDCLEKDEISNSSSSVSSSSSKEYEKKSSSSCNDEKESSSSVKSSSSKKINSEIRSSSSVVYSSSYIEVVDEDVGEGFVKIGNQIWMDHNLNDKHSVDFLIAYCYGDNLNLCKEYGMLIDWIGASDYNQFYNKSEITVIDVVEPHQGRCPDGTHLPSKGELEELISYLKNYPSEGNKITNILGGVSNDRGDYSGVDSVLVLWSSTHDGIFNILEYHSNAWALRYTKTSGFTLESIDKNTYGSVRCIKNESSSSDSQVSSSSAGHPVLTHAEGCDDYTRENWDYLNPNVEYGCIKDERDGRFYKTVMIKDRVWLAENLRYVPKKASYCYTSIGDECDMYGRYYSGYALREGQNVCPEGFHLPTEQDVDLLRSIPITDLLSAKVWSASAEISYEPENSTGFSILPGGMRTGTNSTVPENEFIGVGFSASLWADIPYNGLSGHGEMSFFNRTDCPEIDVFGRIDNWASNVRCIND
ncbi:MAG: hypothetical protein J6U20_11195 [Fibrobacter sp.]|nr:hypothetical protein [Fibrobacter sp.]